MIKRKSVSFESEVSSRIYSGEKLRVCDTVILEDKTDYVEYDLLFPKYGQRVNIRPVVENLPLENDNKPREIYDNAIFFGVNDWDQNIFLRLLGDKSVKMYRSSVEESKLEYEGKNFFLEVSIETNIELDPFFVRRLRYHLVTQPIKQI